MAKDSERAQDRTGRCDRFRVPVEVGKGGIRATHEAQVHEPGRVNREDRAGAASPKILFSRSRCHSAINCRARTSQEGLSQKGRAPLVASPRTVPAKAVTSPAPVFIRAAMGAAPA
jgi:hypothetical protein